MAGTSISVALRLKNRDARTLMFADRTGRIAWLSAAGAGRQMMQRCRNEIEDTTDRHCLLPRLVHWAHFVQHNGP
jgi:hypothetical protein